MSKGVKILLFLLILAVLVVVGYFFLHSYAKDKAEENVAAFFGQLDGVAEASYGDVDVDLLGRSAVVHDMKLSFLGGQSFSVDEFVLRDYEEDNGWPKAADFSVRGVEVPVTPENMDDAYDMFSDLGMKTVTFDFDMAYAFDEHDDSFKLSDMALKVRKLGSLGVSFQLDNVDFDTLVATEGASAITLALSDAEIRFEDDSFIEMALKAGALEEGKTTEQVLQEGLDEIDKEIASAKDNGDDQTVEALEAFKKFVKNPGTIAITMRPKHPVSILSLVDVQDVATVMEKLNMKIEVR